MLSPSTHRDTVRQTNIVSRFNTRFTLTITEFCHFKIHIMTFRTDTMPDSGGGGRPGKYTIILFPLFQNAKQCVGLKSFQWKVSQCRN